MCSRERLLSRIRGVKNVVDIVGLEYARRRGLAASYLRSMIEESEIWASGSLDER